MSVSLISRKYEKITYSFRHPSGAARGQVTDEDEDQTVYINFQLLLDDPSLYEKEEESKGDAEQESEEPPQFLPNFNINDMNSNVYSDEVIYGPDNIIFDFQHGACLGYMLSLKNYSSMAKSTVRIFKSLLLRKESKTQAVRFIKYLVLKKTSLDILTKIFLKIHGVYKDATTERKRKTQDGNNSEIIDLIKTSSASVGGPANQVMRSMSLAMTNSGQNVLPSQYGSTRLSNKIISQCEDVTRIMSGEVITFQHEMVQIFNDIIDMDSLPYSYMRSIIVEYIRCLQEFTLPSQPKLQSILWKYIWKNRDFIGLQNLLQYKVLDDTLELAQHLVQLGCDLDLGYDTKNIRNSITTLSVFYFPAFDYGLNMLYRLRQYKDVFGILILVGKYSKAIDFAKSIPLDNWTKYSEFRDIVESDKSLTDRNRKLLVQRINNLKQTDDRLIHQNAQYRPFFADIKLSVQPSR
jgi:hypothetical protein